MHKADGAQTSSHTLVTHTLYWFSLSPSTLMQQREKVRNASLGHRFMLRVGNQL